MADLWVPGSGPRQRGLSDVVYEHVLSGIMDGTYPQNGRLPAESALAERLEVSRPVVREAFSRLRDDGLILSRQGSGSYVIAQPSHAVKALAPLSSISDMQRCFEFRVGLEGEGAYQAALRRTDADVARLGAAFDALEMSVQRNSLAVVEDYDFHLAVCTAAHNRFYVGTLDYLRDNIVTGINVTRSLSLRRSAERLSTVQREHKEIVSAITEGDAEHARFSMRQHLENARHRLFEGVDDE